MQADKLNSEREGGMEEGRERERKRVWERERERERERYKAKISDDLPSSRRVGGGIIGRLKKKKGELQNVHFYTTQKDTRASACECVRVCVFICVKERERGACDWMERKIYSTKRWVCHDPKYQYGTQAVWQNKVFLTQKVSDEKKDKQVHSFKSLDTTFSIFFD